MYIYILFRSINATCLQGIYDSYFLKLSLDYSIRTKNGLKVPPETCEEFKSTYTIYTHEFLCFGVMYNFLQV